MDDPSTFLGQEVSEQSAVKIQITVVGPLEEEDENAVAILSEAGVMIDSADLGSLQIRWSDLKRILSDPFAEEMLENADQEDW